MFGESLQRGLEAACGRQPRRQPRRSGTVQPNRKANPRGFDPEGETGAIIFESHHVCGDGAKPGTKLNLG